MSPRSSMGSPWCQKWSKLNKILKSTLSCSVLGQFCGHSCRKSRINSFRFVFVLRLSPERDFLDLSCRVRGWESVCWEVLGISSLGSEKVSCFVCFLAFGFLVSTIYQITIWCFQEEIDPISNIFKRLLDGSSGCFGAHLFKQCQHCGFLRKL